MNFELITAIIFYLIIAIIIYKNKKKIVVMDKVFFVYKWKKGVEYLKKIAKHPSLWKIFITIGLPICFIGIIFSIHMLWSSAIAIFNTPNPTPTIQLLIPGVKLPGSDFYVPFWYGIISIIAIILAHEGMHGVIAIVEKIKLKSTGIGMFLFFPLAFVEPDEKSMKKASLLSRLRVYAAGSYGNLTLALLLFLLGNFILNPLAYSMINYTNVSITHAINGLPANLSGVPDDVVIISLNDIPINNLTGLSNEMDKVAVNETVSLQTDKGNYTFNATSNPNNINNSYLGILINQNWEYKKELSSIPTFFLQLPVILITLLGWIIMLSLSIGIFNLYPLWITDGGKIVYELINKVVRNEKTAAMLSNLVFIFALVILLFNFLAPYFL